MVGEVGAATAKATQTARQTREAYEPEAPPNASEDFPHLRIGSSRLRT